MTRLGKMINWVLSHIEDWTFVHTGRIHLVWLALAITALLVVLELRGRDALSAFLSPVMQRRLTAQASLPRVLVKLGLVLLSMLAAIGALMRPQGRGETEAVTASHDAADVMFVLDTSRSMLAEDTAPTAWGWSRSPGARRRCAR